MYQIRVTDLDTGESNITTVDEFCEDNKDDHAACQAAQNLGAFDGGTWTSWTGFQIEAVEEREANVPGLRKAFRFNR